MTRPKKYPNPDQIKKDFKNRGLRFLVGLRIAFLHDGPFTSQAVDKEFFIMEKGKPKSYLIGFPKAPVYLLDVHKPEAVERNVDLCEKWGVDGFKEDLYGYGAHRVPRRFGCPRPREQHRTSLPMDDRRCAHGLPLVWRGLRDRQQPQCLLPAGDWIDYDSGKRFTGPTMLEDFELPVTKTPLFIGGTGVVIEESKRLTICIWRLKLHWFSKSAGINRHFH